mgnify:FL=1
MNKKKIIIAVILLLLIIGIVLFFAFRNNKTVLTVSYEVNGEIIKTENIEEGKTVIKPTDPTRDGYDFLGWFLGTEKFNFSTAIKENIKLEAKWISKTDDNNRTRTITLDIDGKKEEVKTDASGVLSEVKDPTKSGYKFLGWYIGDEKVDLSKPFEEDTTIVAKWKKVKSESNSNNKNNTTPSTPTKPEEPTVTKYTVTFDSDGGSSVSKQTVVSGKTATKPSNPTRSGYTFKGWYLNGAEYNFPSKVTKNITLTAKWEKNKVVSYVTEDLGGVVGQIKIYVTVDGNKVAGTVDITSKEGKTITKEVPATGLVWNNKTTQSISNPKVK